MGKKSAVRTIMEQRLSPYGFVYDNYALLRWTFRRGEGVDLQYVVVQKSNWSDSYTLEIEVDNETVRLYEITDRDPKYSADFLDYNSEEERSAILNEIADIIIEYGIDKLNKMTEKRKIRGERHMPTERMCKKLYEENAALTQHFMEQNHASDLPEEDILTLIKQRFEELQGKAYDEVQDQLVELVAVYGNMLIKKVGGRWVLGESGDHIETDITLKANQPILYMFVRRWQEGTGDALIKNYVETCSDIIEWVNVCREKHGPDWKPDPVYANWELPF